MNDDLISRSALKDEISSACYNCASRDDDDYNCKYHCPIYDFLKHIDNAPTVELNDMTAYFSGFEMAKQIHERPQGEWEESHIFSCGKILRMGLNVIENKCKNCGRWSIKWERTIPDNFCSNCGADMRGKGEEE